MTSRKHLARKAKDTTPNKQQESDDDVTPTKDNCKDNEDDLSSKDSDDHSMVSESLANEINNATKTFKEHSLNDSNDNPHSAQANLNKLLQSSSEVDKLQQLAIAAAEKAAKCKERAIRKRAKKRQEQARAAQKKASKKRPHL